MKISVKFLRKIIREAIGDTMMAYTEPAPASQQSYQAGDHQAMRDTQGTNKANQVAKIVNQKTGNTSATQRVQQYVAQMDPQQRLVLTADQIAQEFLSQK